MSRSILPSPPLAALILVVGLTACTFTPPLALPSGHSANPNAVEGLVDAPTALASYRTFEDFAASTTNDLRVDRMENMSGINHDSMQGMASMQHQGAPSPGKGQ